MGADEERSREDAAGWVVRRRDPFFADWAGFTDWLEADPAHNALYEEAALVDAELGDWLAPAPAIASANDNPALARRPARRRIAAWSAAAAAMLAAVISYPMIGTGDGAYDVTTAPGEQRDVTLADGTRIALNGGTRLTLHRNDTRLASLDSGEATFTVVHDAAHPFAVETGGDRIEDVGTVFNVARSAEGTEVGVAEGAVVYNPGREAVHLPAGRTLRVSTGSAAPLVIRTAAPETIGAWRTGRLVYRGARIGRVASDVSRYLGVPVTADATIAERPFDGIIMLDHDPKRLFARLGPLLDVTARPSERGWRLTSSLRETR